VAMAAAQLKKCGSLANPVGFPLLSGDRGVSHTAARIPA